MKMFNRKTVIISLSLALSAGIGSMAFASGGTAVGLGSASGFAVIASSTITNTGSTVINGDLGLSPGTSVTGFPPGVVNGTQHIADSAAASAVTDLTTAFSNAAGQTPVTTIPTELGGSTLTPGIYDSASGTFGLTGTLTLDAQGDAAAVFIFKTASTFITTSSSSIVLAGSAQSCNVFWQVGSSATFGANSTLKGSVLISSSATLNTGVTVDGRIFAENGAVTLDSNTITVPVCAAVVSTPPPAPVVVTPVVVVPVVVAPVVSVPVVVAPVTTVPVLAPTVVVPILPNTGIGPEDSF